MSWIDKNGLSYLWNNIKEKANAELIKYTTNDSGWINLTPSSNFDIYSTGQQPRIKKQGNMVIIDGAFKPKATIASSQLTSWLLVSTVPDGWNPSHVVYKVIQGSGRAKCKLQINSSGQILIANYGNRTTTSSIGNTVWLPMNVEYYCAVSS